MSYGVTYMTPKDENVLETHCVLSIYYELYAYRTLQPSNKTEKKELK